MALMNFVDRGLPVISAAWLNAVDKLKFTVFADAETKAAARTALTSDAALEITNGGTGQRSAASAFAALYNGSILPVANGGTGASTLNALGIFGTELGNTPHPSTKIVDLGSVASHVQVVNMGGAAVPSFGSNASTAVPIYIVRFSSAGTLTHSASLLLPGAANITVAAGDFALTEYMGSGIWRVGFYQSAFTPTATTGTFAITLNGFSSSDIPATLRYTKIGNLVSIVIPAFSGTVSNASPYISGLPANLRPITQDYILPIHAINMNNVTWDGGAVQIAQSAGANMYLLTPKAANQNFGWTLSPSSGVIADSCITYLAV